MATMRITDFGSTWARCGDHTLKRAQGSRAPAEITFTLRQGTDGFSLISSARICELYSGAPDPSYVCSIKGAEQRWPSPEDSRDQQENEQQQRAEQGSPPTKVWRIEHRWSPSEHAPATLTLRLLSLAQKDVLHVRSLRLLPAEDARQAGADSALPAAAAAEADGGVQEQGADGAAAGGNRAAQGLSRSAAPSLPAAGLSQVESVRSMLGQLAAADGSGSGSGGGGGGGAQADPKRALLAAIARSVLQQPRPPSRGGDGLELVPLAAACGPAAQGQQQQQQQQRGDEAECEGGLSAAEGQLVRQVLGAVGRLEARVARLEEACAETNSLLRQLAASLLPQRAV